MTTSAPVRGAAPPQIESEFRAAWIATVANIDWPSKPGLSVKRQKQEFVDLLDAAVDLNLNAVVLQVRPACDAIYRSELEPWSSVLSGRMGVAPDPAYDPLEFAVAEAHRRGLQLHAWFNPYRASHPSYKGELSSDHVSERLPNSVVEYGSYLWLDPSDADAAKHSLDVILDVVRRYDIDGVHFDDYFYPYPITQTAEDANNGLEGGVAKSGKVPFPDDRSWNAYVASTDAGERLARPDWRRQSINNFVRDVYHGVKREKPHVLFGISPFGIWRPGHPASVVGFDAYAELYADSKLWLEEGWVDYFTPQLYWPVRSSGQSYPVLLEWWTRQNPHGRPIWPGLFTSKVRQSPRGKDWGASEIVEQVQITQAFDDAGGNVHFSMKALSQNYGGVADALREGPYRTPALPPNCGALGGASAPPAQPTATLDAGRIRLQPDAAPWLWAVQTRDASGWTTRVLPGATESVEVANGAQEVVITAVDRLGQRSVPARVVPQ
ncbi:glycoside hydrolase family 10 protein [Posidoniimonas corsicana]|uniref:glycoside hydrolase family 10 protein n=1 Tax=Posidoniimonas corsicana TaxID=1938618 RepID=UPI0018D2969A|nr:family 10 glycosylhydrolase [Posidoniimonas corsicana]